MRRHVLQRVACVWLSLGAFGAGVLASTPQNPPGAPASAPQKPDSMTALIAGTVVDAASGKGVAGVTIQLSRVSGSRGQGSPQRPVITDSQGRFYFTRLMAASYAFTPTKTGWSSVSPTVNTRAVDVTDGGKVTDVKIPMVQQAAITGTVRDDAGDVVVGSTMMLFRRAQVNGQTSWSPEAAATTDDRGAFRFSAIAPGSYLVCACDRDPVPFDGTVLTTLAAEPIKLMGLAARAAKVGSDVASLDGTLRTYAPTFFPSSATVARAERITVGSGEERGSIDITTPAVRAVRVSGTVVGADGPLNAQGFSLLSSNESDEGAVLTRMSPMVVQPDGRFDFANVPPGTYTLRVMWSPMLPASGPTGTALQFLGSRFGPSDPSQNLPDRQSAPPKFGSLMITVGDRDLAGLSVPLRAAPTISGHIKMADGAPLPPAQELARMMVFVAPLDPMTMTPAFPTGRVSPDGSFTLSGIAPGRYRLTVSSSQSAQSIKSIDVRGVDFSDTPIDVTSDITDVVVTMSPSGPASIRGTVTGAGVSDGLTALLFPADRKLWPNAVAAVRRFRPAAVSRKGEFTMGALAAGEYLLAVVPDMQAVDWQDPEKLDVLSRTAQRVTVADGERKTVEVKR